MNYKYEEKIQLILWTVKKQWLKTYKDFFFPLEIDTENSIVVRNSLEGNGNFYSFRKLQSLYNLFNASVIQIEFRVIKQQIHTNT